jgi:transposase
VALGGSCLCPRRVVERLGERWSPAEKEAAVWKRCADAAACGHLLVDLANAQLTRLAPLICLPPDSPPILPDPLPSHLESSTHQEDSHPLDASVPEENDGKPDLLSTFDDSFLDEKQRERFLRTMRAVEAVRNGATVREAAAAAGMGRSTLGRLVQRTVEFGQLACVPRATYHREREVHPAFQQTIRLLYSRPSKLSIRAIDSTWRTETGCIAFTAGHWKGVRPPKLRSGEAVHPNASTGTQGAKGAR